MKNHVAKILVKTRTHSCRELQALIFREIIVPVLTKVFRISDNKPEVRREYATVSYEQTSQVG
ncbi:hypothetical protein SAMN04487897_10994 [Paenibacillus sp. yr247]|nr:hypothetical protein SAMN04487897_10994 [Paenibacillus sp. yr247]